MEIRSDSWGRWDKVVIVIIAGILSRLNALGSRFEVMRFLEEQSSSNSSSNGLRGLRI
jgi:hypothetical protein